MKYLQNMSIFTIIIMVNIFFSGCGLLYDCEAAETEIETMEINLTTPPLVENFTFTKCSAYWDKMNEYVDEGCGTIDGGNDDCEYGVCTVQNANLLAYALSAWSAALSYDSTAYCSYYDSVGMVMQVMVDAGGCATYMNDGVGYAQTDVDEYIANGCDWGDSTTVNSIIPGQGHLTKLNIRGSNELIKLEELLDQMPDNYSNPIRKRLNTILSG